MVRTRPHDTYVAADGLGRLPLLSELENMSWHVLSCTYLLDVKSIDFPTTDRQTFICFRFPKRSRRFTCPQFISEWPTNTVCVLTTLVVRTSCNQRCLIAGYAVRLPPDKTCLLTTILHANPHTSGVLLTGGMPVSIASLEGDDGTGRAGLAARNPTGLML